MLIETKDETREEVSIEQVEGALPHVWEQTSEKEVKEDENEHSE